MMPPAFERDVLRRAREKPLFYFTVVAGMPRRGFATSFRFHKNSEY
jgi:hypothetical protein